MDTEELLRQHRCSVGGAAGIDYIYTLGTSVVVSNIDIVTRCETAARLVSAGFEKGFFRVHPILIIGGGPAGLTAVMTALSLGIEGVALSSGLDFFSLQRSCTHRFLHPHIYGWPREGFDQPNYNPPEYGLRWYADFADQVVKQWDTQLDIVSEDRRFQRREPIPADTQLTSTDDLLRVIVTPDREQEFGMVLFCIAPREKVAIGSFEGTPFWVNDGLAGSTERSFLVCGSGDGALQDFLRLLCPNRNIVELQQILSELLTDLSKRSGQSPLEPVEQVLANSGESFDEIHEACESLVKRTIHSDELRGQVERFIETACLGLPADREVTLAWPKNYFGKCYLLNRILTLFVAEGLRCLCRRTCLRPSTQVVSVRQLLGGGCEAELREIGGAIVAERYDRVIPRLGVERLSPEIMNQTLTLRSISTH